MAVKLKIPLALLAFFCFFSTLYYLYLYQIDDPLAEIHCESSLLLSHTLESSDGTREGMVMEGAMNFSFTGGRQGVLVIGGIISGNTRRYQFKRTFDFNYIPKPIFYEFTFQPTKDQNDDEAPDWLIHILLAKIGNHLEISRLDANNLLISNMFSPMQVCNITQ